MPQRNLIDDPLALPLEWVEVFSTIIPGEPQQRGSKTALVPQKGPKGQTCPACNNPLRQACRDKFGRVIVSMTDSNKDSGPYMEFARGWLGEAWGRGREPIEFPVAVSAAFYFQRPKSHYGTGKNAGIVKGSSPDFHVSSPDLDKLLRCVCDCLTNIVIADDRLIAEYLTPTVRRWTDGKSRTELRLFVPAAYAAEVEDRF